MSTINTGRLVLAGLAAAVVMNVVGYVTNAVILAQQWSDAAKALGLNMEKIGPFGWVVMGLVIGMVIAWIYAAIRPRYGSGTGTGLRAGFAAWLVMDAALAAAFNGLYPRSLLLCAFAGGLVSALGAGVVASMLYREPE